MTMTPRGGSRRRAVVAAACAAILAAVGGAVALEEARVVADLVTAPAAADFADQPAQAAAGAPGTLVKTEELAGLPIAARGWRIMYRSTDLEGRPVVVTGVLVVPLTPPPASGRTVVSWGHPTTGTALSCAPSRALDPTVMIEGLRALLDRGYAVVATDYAGMGTPGPDSYLIGATEGANVLDAARAATHVDAAEASGRVILWGHSQGGQAVLFAAERAAAYAPELSVEAVAVAAPAADLGALMTAHLDDISGVTIGSYAFTAFAQVYADRAGTELAGILTPQAIALQPQLNGLCLLTDVTELHRIGEPLVGAFTTADPVTREPWRTLLAENSAGGRPFAAPLYSAQGLKDQLVAPSDTAAFAQHESALGIAVTYEQIAIADHGSVAYLALPGLLTWLDRLGV